MTPFSSQVGSWRAWIKHFPGAWIADLKMPEMSGIELYDLMKGAG